MSSCVYDASAKSFSPPPQRLSANALPGPLHCAGNAPIGSIDGVRKTPLPEVREFAAEIKVKRASALIGDNCNPLAWRASRETENIDCSPLPGLSGAVVLPALMVADRELSLRHRAHHGVARRAGPFHQGLGIARAASTHFARRRSSWAAGRRATADRFSSFGLRVHRITARSPGRSSQAHRRLRAASRAPRVAPATERLKKSRIRREFEPQQRPSYAASEPGRARSDPKSSEQAQSSY